MELINVFKHDFSCSILETDIVFHSRCKKFIISLTGHWFRLFNNRLPSYDEQRADVRSLANVLSAITAQNV